MYQYYIQVSLNLPFLQLFLLVFLSSVSLPSPLNNADLNCTSKPYFVHNCSFSLHTCILSQRVEPALKFGAHLPGTCHFVCIKECLQKSLSLQHNFVDLIVCDLSWQQNSVEETINIRVNLSLQCFTTTCCCNLLPSRLFEGIRPKLQKAL